MPYADELAALAAKAYTAAGYRATTGYFCIFGDLKRLRWENTDVVARLYNSNRINVMLSPLPLGGVNMYIKCTLIS